MSNMSDSDHDNEIVEEVGSLTGTFNAAIVGHDEPCTVYLDPQHRTLFEDVDDPGERKLAMCYTTTASVTDEDGIEQFIPVGSYGAMHPPTDYAAVAVLGRIDPSSKIAWKLMPRNRTLHQLLGQNGSDLGHVLKHLGQVEDPSAGPQGKETYHAWQLGEPAASPAGWQRMDVISAATDRTKAVHDFGWSRTDGGSPQDAELKSRDFQPVPHDATLLVLRDELPHTEFLFSSSDSKLCAFEFNAAHCRRPDGSVGPGLHVQLRGSESFTALREQLAVFEEELLRSEAWKDLVSKYFDLSLTQRDTEIFNCVGTTWRKLQGSTSTSA